MKRIRESNYKLALVVVGMVLFLPLLQWARAQGRKAPVHLTTDWSNRHMIFSQPSSMALSMRLWNEPRYGHQWLRRNPGVLLPNQQDQQARSEVVREPDPGNPLPIITPFRRRIPPPISDGTPPPSLRADWGVSMQAGGTTGTEMYPAKFSFDVTAAPDCTNDFIVYNSGLPSAAGVVASKVGTFANSTSTNGQTVTITNGADSLVLFNNTGASPTTAQATVTITATPNNNDTITVGATTYRFVTALAAANDVLRGASGAVAAQNLKAILDNAIGECNAATTCFNVATTTAPNPSVAHPVGEVTNVDTLTGPSDGAAGNFTLTLGAGEGARFTLGGNAVGGAGANDGQNFQGSTGNNSTNATNLANAILRFTSTLGAAGIANSPAAGQVTVDASSTGTDGNLIAVAATTAGFSWAAGGTLTGGAGQSSIFALNNLYSTQGGAAGFCGNSGPSIMWSYQTSTLATKGGSVTSPVISGDGTKIAYVETSTSGAVLHLLKWKSGEGTGVGDAATPATTLAAGQNWVSNCPAANSCIANLTFNGGAADQDTNSSPFYDYNTDNLYIGDNNGKLHKFSGVFLGTPAEITSGGWPFAVTAAGIILSSPVMDNSSHNIFVGANNGTLSYVKEVGSVTGTCSGGGNATPCLGLSLGATTGAITTINVTTGANATANGTAASGAVVDAPIVDGSVGVLFVVNGTETGANHGTMIETNTALGSGTAGSVLANQRIGGDAGPPNASPLHTGAFDNAYLNSAGGTGSLYVCGKEQVTGHNSRPAIYKFALTAGIMTTVPSGTTTNELLGIVSNSTEDCSPVTEIQNGAKEYIFFSVGNNANNGTNNGGTGLPDAIPVNSPCFTDQAGCLISIEIDSAFLPTWPPTLVTHTISLPSGGTGASTGGIIVDNVSASSQASSIYFALTVNAASGTGNPGLPECNGHTGVGCTVKLTQAALQ
jgi:hypothetical protein